MQNIDFELSRFNAIEQQIRPWGVNNIDLLAALNAVHREDFVLPKYKTLAFSDTELSLSEFSTRQARYLLNPKVEARILQSIYNNIIESSKPTENSILIIGSDLGYIAAVLSYLKQSVSLLDENQHLLNIAKTNNKLYNFKTQTINQNFNTKIEQKYNAIITTASVDNVPSIWLDALENQGQLIAFVGEAPILEARQYIKKSSVINYTVLFETWVSRMPSIPPANKFSF